MAFDASVVPPGCHGRDWARRRESGILSRLKKRWAWMRGCFLSQVLCWEGTCIAARGVSVHLDLPQAARWTGSESAAT